MLSSANSRADVDDSFFGLPGADRPAEGLPEPAPYGTQEGERQSTWGGEYVSDGMGQWTLDDATAAVARAREALSSAAERAEAELAERMRDDDFRAAYWEDQQDRDDDARRDELGMG